MWWVWTQRPLIVLWCGCPMACFSLCGHIFCRSGLWPKFHSILLPLVSLPLSHCYVNPFFTMAPRPWLDTIPFPSVDLERCCLWRRHLPPSAAPLQKLVHLSVIVFEHQSVVMTPKGPRLDIVQDLCFHAQQSCGCCCYLRVGGRAAVLPVTRGPGLPSLV